MPLFGRTWGVDPLTPMLEEPGVTKVGRTWGVNPLTPMLEEPGGTKVGGAWGVNPLTPVLEAPRTWGVNPLTPMLEAPGCETPLSSALIGSTVRSCFHERSLRSASVSEAAAADLNADAAVSNVGTRVIQCLFVVS